MWWWDHFWFCRQGSWFWCDVGVLRNTEDRLRILDQVLTAHVRRQEQVAVVAVASQNDEGMNEHMSVLLEMDGSVLLILYKINLHDQVKLAPHAENVS